MNERTVTASGGSGNNTGGGAGTGSGNGSGSGSGSTNTGGGAGTGPKVATLWTLAWLAGFWWGFTHPAEALRAAWRGGDRVNTVAYPSPMKNAGRLVGGDPRIPTPLLFEEDKVVSSDRNPPRGAARLPVTPGTTPGGLPEWPEPVTPSMPAGLPALPSCSGAAAVRYEIQRPTGGGACNLVGAINVCQGHSDGALAAASEAGFRLVPLDQDVSSRPCGSGMDFTGEHPRALTRQAGSAPAPVEGQPAGRRIARANTMRELSRLCYAVDQPALPAPVMVRFIDDTGPDRVVIVRCDTIAEAEAWAERFDVLRDAQVMDTIAENGHRVRVFTAWTQWRGLSLVMSAVVPPDGCPVPAGPRPAPVDLSTYEALAEVSV
ncbi:hypothetical protein [Micromonospora humidisoli]|uniref:Uncharacterized protein n=1 Tax=Micromonospora humidisoli TaxID=2807622 RepID=A0ABS2JAP5_9ACTN|nr:hypothetical protein [Micromonospora humidisoli]MBM7083631.1 hypothetical protein [Micromonospora humidisoli]